MAEPATAPEPAASNGAAPPPDVSEVGLLDVLEALPEKPAEAADEPEATAGDEPKKKEAKPEKAKAAPAKDESKAENEKPGADPDAELELDEALFTPEALATKEGVQRAGVIAKTIADAVKKRNEILDRYDQRIKKRDAKTKAERDEAQRMRMGYKEELDREIAPLQEAARGVLAELRILDPRSGATAQQRFAALGRLNGGIDGQQLYEQWTLGIASDGKMPAPSRAEAELHARIEQLEAALRQKVTGDQDAQQGAKIEHMKSVVAGQMAEIRTMAGNAETYPTIASRVAALGDEGGAFLEEVADWVKSDIVKAHEKGAPIDKATAIGRVEARLAALTGGKPAAAAAKPTESGSTKQPGSPARGAGRGTTLLPDSADRSTGHLKEKMSEAERNAMNARDADFMDALGLPWRQE